MNDERAHRSSGTAGDSRDDRSGDPLANRALPQGLVEKLRQVRGELAASREELARCRIDLDLLCQRLEGFEREHCRACDDRAALEGRISEVNSHCVVMERIHGALDHAEVLSAIQEVITCIIGSEELAVFELSEDGRSLRPTKKFGVEGRGLGVTPVGAGPIGRVVAQGKGWVVGDGPPPPEHPDLTACVPLEAAGCVVGAIVIWRLLDHRPPLGAADRAVLAVLAKHAGTALHLTSLHERDRRAPVEAPGFAS